MSTYGPVNGIWTASSYDLLTSILRNEWRFDGIVMTDWWAMGNDEAGAPGDYKNVAAQVRAQNDLNMVTGNAGENSNKDNLEQALLDGKLERSELVRNAENILRFLLKTPAYRHMLGEESELDEELKSAVSTEDMLLQEMIKVKMNKDETELDVSQIKIEKGESTTFILTAPGRVGMDLELVVRADNQPDVAQLPMSIFQGTMLVKTVTLTGMDKQWQTLRIKLFPAFLPNFYLKFYFAQGGLEIREAKVIVTEDLEKMFDRGITELS